MSARPAAWQRDLASRVALRLRGTRPVADRRVRLALELLRRTGAEPPAHEPLTLAWIAGTPPDRLAGDPLLDAMAPRLFETEGVGRLLRDDAGWPATLAELARTGRIARQALLDGCRTRFLRGGGAADMRFFVRLHERLDPAPEELAGRLPDYLALLPAAAANVADLALQQVRRLGPVPPADAGEAVQGLLFRKEGKLVRAGLTWLDRLLKEDGGDLDAYAPALAVALVCEAADARERAVKLAVKHASRFGPTGAETLREAVATLPAHQGAELAAAFGGDVAEPEPETFVPGTLPPAPRAAPMPPPIRTPEELARLTPREGNWMGEERWLDGFVKLASGPGRDRLTAALAGRTVTDDEYAWRPWWHTAQWIGAMARELTDPGAESRVPHAAPPEERIPEMTHAAAWRLMPLMRYAEVHRALADRRLPPFLLATPTRANGLLDPETLVERLEGYERAGVEALPLDLRQALLRMGRAAGPEVAARAERLSGPAGRKVARWLTDRPADPEVTLRREEHQGGIQVFSEFSFGPEHREAVGDLLVHRWHEESPDLTLAVFAGHRELVAARCAWSSFAYFGAFRSVPLDLLATADGPAGPGMSWLLACRLVNDYDGEAVERFLRLAASGGVAGEELGRQLADVLRHSEEGPRYALAALREAAGRGAHREVWDVMTGWLPACLPGPGERATTAHTRVVTLAADVASWAGARGELPVIAELAARSRGSELVRQARRLHACLTA
ncbi:DUF6493 family protein [Nonomuraea sp. CA-218870]|uniref:DUF7824 domain-containing protein n=1 Tax=Nonomuraea sp. CA-218870 TaxID=3239998 RepID=UPI003D8D14E9